MGFWGRRERGLQRSDVLMMCLKPQKKGYPRQRRPLRHDQRPRPQRRRHAHPPGNDGYHAPRLGDVGLLLRHARRCLPDDFPAPALPRGQGPGRPGRPLGHDRHAHGHGDVVARALRSALLPRVRRECDSDRFHVYRQRVLYAAGASPAPELVVLLNRRVDDHRGCFELWLRSDHGRFVGEMAVCLSAGWRADCAFRMCVLCGSQLRGVGCEFSFPSNVFLIRITF